MAGDRAIDESQRVVSVTGGGCTGEVVVGSGDRARARPGQIRGVGEDVKGHGRGAKNFHAVGVRGDKSKEAVQVGHGRKRGGGLCAGQRTSGGQDAPVKASTIVKEIADRYLQLFLLGGGGGWRRIGGGVLGSRRADEPKTGG